MVLHVKVREDGLVVIKQTYNFELIEVIWSRREAQTVDA